MRCPNGFKELVDLVEECMEKPKLVKNDKEMWEHFCWAVLLGGNRNESEVNFVYDLLFDYGLFDRENLNPDWLTEARYCLSIEKEKISELNIKGKIAAINKIEAEIENHETSLKSADEIFGRMGINASYLTSIKDDKEKEDNLLCQIASQDETKCTKYGYSSSPSHKYKIPWVAYTKAILWLHECGIGLNYIPNNSHSINFLDECDAKWKTPNKSDFFVIQGRIREFCNYFKKDIYFSGLSLWYYGATKSLISRKNKPLYSPKKLLLRMEEYDLDIEDLSDMLGDIEKIEELKEILN